MDKKNGKILELVYASAELIYKDWAKKRTPSARVIDEVRSNILLKDADGSSKALLRAFCYLCALEIRIKKRYKSLFSKIISFISWRKELAALKRFKFKLGLYSEERISLYIERELWMLDVTELAELYNEIKNGTVIGALLDDAQPSEINSEEGEELNEKDDTRRENTFKKEEKAQNNLTPAQREEISELTHQPVWEADEPASSTDYVDEPKVELADSDDTVRERIDVDVDRERVTAKDATMSKKDGSTFVGELEELSDIAQTSDEATVENRKNEPYFDNTFLNESAPQGEAEAPKAEKTDNINLNNYYSRERESVVFDSKSDVYNPMQPPSRSEVKAGAGTIEAKPTENLQKNSAEQVISEAQENQSRNSITEEIIDKGEDFLRMYIETAKALARDMMERETQAYIQEHFIQANPTSSIVGNNADRLEVSVINR